MADKCETCGHTFHIVHLIVPGPVRFVREDGGDLSRGAERVPLWKPSYCPHCGGNNLREVKGY